MARIEQAIFTNLCMISDGAGNILVQDRKNPDWKGITFPGGHVEAGEAFTDAVVREVFEETGLVIEDPVLCGVKQFPLKDGTRYVVFCYKATRYHGTLRSSQEGEVFWIPRETLADYTLAPQFDILMSIFESETLSEFFLYREKGDEWAVRLL